MRMSLQFKGLPGEAESGTRGSSNLPRAGFPSAVLLDFLGHGVDAGESGVLGRASALHRALLDVCDGIANDLEAVEDLLGEDRLRRGGVGGLGLGELLGEGARLALVLLLGQLALRLGLSRLSGVGTHLLRVSLLLGVSEVGRRAVLLDQQGVRVPGVEQAPESRLDPVVDS